MERENISCNFYGSALPYDVYLFSFRLYFKTRHVDYMVLGFTFCYIQRREVFSLLSTFCSEMLFKYFFITGI